MYDVLTLLFSYAAIIGLAGTKRPLTLKKAEGDLYTTYRMAEAFIFDFGYVSLRQKHAGFIIAIHSQVFILMKVVQVIPIRNR